MSKLKMLIELEYDAETMHGDDPEGLAWFVGDVLDNKNESCGLILHSNEIGDSVGTVKVLDVISGLDLK